MKRYLPSLRTVLILSFGLITILLSSISGLLVKQKLNTELEHNVSENLTRVSEEFSAQITKSLTDRFNSLQNLGASDEFKRGTISSVELNNALIKIKTVEPRFAWLGFANINGKLIASTLPVLEGSDVKDRTWFDAGKNGIYFGDMYDSQTMKKYLGTNADEHFRLVDISIPVKDKKGFVIGVLCAQLSWNWAVDVENSFDYPYIKDNNIQLFVINSKYITIIGPEQLMGKTIFDKTLKEAHLTDNQSGFAHDTLNGEKRVIGFTSVANGLNWYTVAARREVDAYSVVTQANIEILAVAGLCTVLMLLLSSFIAYKLTAPLNKMVADVHRLTNKVEDVHTDISIQTDEIEIKGGYKELSNLSDEFNKMLKAIASGDFKAKYYEKIVQKQIIDSEESNNNTEHH